MSRVYEETSHVTEIEAAEFEERADEIIASASGAGTLEDDAVKLMSMEINAEEGEGRYKVVNLIGKFTSPNGNWGVTAKTLGCIGHYNGPAVPARAWEDPVAWIRFINDLHAETGRFSPGWKFDGIAYHEFISGDTVYRCRDYGAKLPHCGNLTYNAGSLGIHIPVGVGQTPSDLTYRTFFQRVSDHNAVMRVGRAGLRGHREVGASACPGDIIQSAINSYRAGKNPGGLAPVPKPEPVKPDPAVPAWLPGVRRIAFQSYSKEQLDSEDPFVLTLSGDDEAAIVPKGMAFLVPKVEEKPPEKPADPKPSGAAKIIDDYFRSSYHSLGTYENIGQIIVEEAERAGIALQAACALVEQESGGRNVFGCDAGNVGDRPPYCRQPCTRERVQKLIAHIRAGGTSNGTSVCQLTYPSFIFEAEALGGAHVPRNSMRVGFKLLASYFAKYGELDGYGSFNAGEGNRASVRHTYSAACVSKSRAWRSHLGSFAAYVEEAPPLPIEEEEMTEPERPETTKPKLSKAAKAIIAAAVPLVSALLLWASTGTLDETEFSVGATGLLTALLVYFVPNSGEASTD